MKRRIQIIYWVLSCLLIFGFITLSFQQEHDVERTKFDSAAKALQLNFNVFIETLESDITLLDQLIPQTQQCTKITPQLQAFSFSHPQVSAIAVKEAPNLYCSSALNLPAAQSRPLKLYLSGPSRSPLLAEKFYTLSYRVNQRTYEIYLLSSVLRKALSTPDRLIGNIEIYNAGQNDPVIQLNTTTKAQQLRINHKALRQYQRIELKYSIKQNLRLHVYNNQQQSFKVFWFYKILQLSLILIGIMLIYIPLHLMLTRRYSLHGSIRNAIRNGHFFPVYQPIFDWKKKQYAAVEVLLRWQDNDNTIIMPNTFIEEAEKSGLIEPITRILIKKSFKEMQYWLQQDQHRHLAFNISAAHLNDKNLFLFLKSHCEKYHIIPEQIMLELTEREVIDAQNEGISDRLQQLRNAGFSLALDDFGTGNASFNYLNVLPINYIKIDKMYIDAIGFQSIPATLIDAIINLAKKLKLGIIAEGVETAEQVKYLKHHQVDLLQGWYYAKAMSAEAFFRFINHPSQPAD